LGAVGLHGGVGEHPVEGLLEDLGGSDVGGHDDAVVHPRALAAGGDDAGAAEVGEVAGDFGLVLIEDVDEVADADFLIADEVEEAEAGGVAECLVEAFDVEWMVRHIFSISVLTNIWNRNIFALTNIWRDL